MFDSDEAKRVICAEDTEGEDYISKRYDRKQRGNCRIEPHLPETRVRSVVSRASQSDWLAWRLSPSAHGCGVIASQVIQLAPTAGHLGTPESLGMRPST